MVQQLTTSLTDGILVWSVLYFIYQVFWSNFFSCLGLGLQGAAAGAGVIRFAQSRPASSIYDAHQMFTWLAQTLAYFKEAEKHLTVLLLFFMVYSMHCYSVLVAGIPLLAVGFCHKDLPVMMNLNMIAMMGVLVASRFMAPGPRQMATEACAGLGLVTIVLVCFRSLNIYGLLGVAIYIAAGKVIGSEGKMSIFLRVDILHIALAIGNVFLAWAILNL